MKTRVVGEFWMERCHGTSSVTRKDSDTVERSQDFDIVANSLDQGCTNEHRMKRFGKACDLNVGFETVELAPVAVTTNCDVDQTEATLVWSTAEHLCRTEDHPRAGAENRHAIGEAPLQGIEEAARSQQPRHGCTLATRHDNRVDRVEFKRRTD